MGYGEFAWLTATPLDRAVDKAIADQNAGRPDPFLQETLDGMEGDILVHPEKYPVLHKLLVEKREERQQ